MNEFTYIFLAALTIALIMQYWLASRQYNHVNANRAKVPEAFKDNISLEAHQKAADYTFAKIKIGRIELIYGTALLLIWTLGGGLNYLDTLWRGWEFSTIITGLGVMLSTFIIMSVFDLPFSVYRTFVLEQKFGFNRTTISTFIQDLFKGVLLMLLIGGPLIWVILWIMETSGPLWWLYVWMVWFGFSLFMMWAYPAFIAPLFNKFIPLEEGDLKQGIESLLQQCGFTSNGIFIMDGSKRSSHGNAYFSGLGNNKRIVFFDTLINTLEQDEVEAVLAHELGHFRLKHIRKRLIGMGLISLGGLALLGWLMQQNWFFSGLGIDLSSTYMALLLFMLLQSVFGFFLTPVMSYWSRRHEFEADSYAAQQRDASKLVTALVKMYEENASTLTPDPVYSGFYDSHPPAPVRINHLLGNLRST